MKNRNVEKLNQIWDLIRSRDEEVIITGLSYLKEHPLIKNLSKHYELYLGERVVDTQFGQMRIIGNYKDCTFKKDIIDKCIQYQQANDFKFHHHLALIQLWIRIQLSTWTRSYSIHRNFSRKFLCSIYPVPKPKGTTKVRK